MTSDRQKDKTMYNKTIYAILFLSAAFCLRAAGQEAQQKNMYDFGFIKENRITEFQINFNAETKIGEKIDIYKKSVTGTTGCTLYFEGRRGDEAVFESKFDFMPCLP